MILKSGKVMAGAQNGTKFNKMNCVIFAPGANILLMESYYLTNSY